MIKRAIGKKSIAMLLAMLMLLTSISSLGVLAADDSFLPLSFRSIDKKTADGYIKLKDTVKITSNAHSADAAKYGIYFNWNVKQKDDCILTVNALPDGSYYAFDLIVQSSGTYTIVHVDGVGIYEVAKNSKNINMIYICNAVLKPGTQVPTLTANVEKVLTLDMVVAFGETAPTQSVLDALEQVRQNLESKGVDMTLSISRENEDGIYEYLTLTGVIEDYGWTPGAKRAVLHVGDSAAPADQTGSIAAALNNKGIAYVAAGVPDSGALISNTLNSKDIADPYGASFVNELTGYLWDLVKDEAGSKLLTVDDTLRYSFDFSDPNNTPMDELLAKYRHSVSGFTGHNGLIEDNDVYGAPRLSLGKVGAYDVYMKACNTDGVWTADAFAGKVTVHRPPVAALSSLLYVGPAGSDCAVLELTAAAYDPDHMDMYAAGIIQEEWQWKSLSDNVWTNGQPPSALPYEDEYIITYRVKDIDGGWSFPASICVSTVGMTPEPEPDIEPPVITLYADKYEIYTDEQTRVYAGATDNVGVTFFEVYVDGRLESTEPGSLYVSFPTTGQKTVEVVAKDEAGNTASDSIVITVVERPDTEPPVITLLAEKTVLYVDEEIWIDATATDNVGVTFFELYADGDLIASSQGRKTVSFTTPGDKVVRAVARDEAGNEAEETITLTVIEIPDTEPPVITITPEKTTLYTGEEIWIDATATDNIGVTFFEVYADDVFISNTQGRQYLSFPEPGEKVFEVTARDAAGNEAKGSLTLTVVERPDTEPPVITLTAEKPSLYVDEEIWIEAAATDNIGVTFFEIYVEKVFFTDEQGRHDVSFATPGTKTIEVLAKDAAGNEAKESLTLTVIERPDTEPPVVTLTAEKDAVYVDEEIWIDARATDNVGVTFFELYAGDDLIAAVPGRYTVSFDEPGYVTIKATARDAAGNETEETLVITIIERPDTEPPVVTLTVEKELLLVGEEIWIEADATDNVGVTVFEVYVDGRLFAEEPGRYTVSFATPGQYKVEVIARDAAENETHEMVVLTVAALAPVISGSVAKGMSLDIAAAFGDLDADREAAYAGALSQVIANLTERGVSVSTTTLEKPVIHRFPYIHYNYTGTWDASVGTWPREISMIQDGDNWRFLGYQQEAYRDFLFTPSEDEDVQSLGFTIEKDKTDWHSVDGGGFLFNTNIVYDAALGYDTIEGYMMLVTQWGLQIWRINKVSADWFHNGAIPQNGLFPGRIGLGTIYGPLLLESGIGSEIELFNRHNFEMEVSPTHISVWHNGDLVVDDFELPEEAVSRGFGPIAAFAPHSCCDQISEFTFSNIDVSVKENRTLAHIVGDHTWTVGADRAVVHFTDKDTSDLLEKKVTGRLASTLNNGGISYYAASTEGNESKLAALKNSAVSSAVLDGDDLGAFIDELTDALWQLVASDVETELFTSGDTLVYSYAYDDPEAEPIIGAEFRYSHDISGFTDNGGLLEDNNEWGALKETLDKVGKYDIYIRADGVEALLGSVTVHRLPVASLNYSLSYGPDGSDYLNLGLVAAAYDPDHMDKPDNGIADEEWMWKKLSDASWTVGQPPATISYENEYLVYYRVLDTDGAWGYPACVYISTLGMTPDMPDTEPPVITLTVDKTEVYVNEYITINAGATDNMGVTYFRLYADGELLSETFGRQTVSFDAPGTKLIEAIARDAAGNEARETVVVTVSEREIPFAVGISRPANGAMVGGIVQIFGGISGGTAPYYYELSIRNTLDGAPTIVASGNVDELAGTLYMWDTTDKDVFPTGNYEIMLYAKDADGREASWVNTVEILWQTVEYSFELVVNDHNGIADINTEVPIKLIFEEYYYYSDTLTVTINGEEIEVDENYEAVFIPDRTGKYVIAASIYDIQGEFVELSVDLIVVDPEDDSYPDVELTSPANGATVTAPADIIGSVTADGLAFWTLEIEQPGSGVMTRIAEGEEAVDGILGSFDPTLLNNGLYNIILTGYGANYISEAIATVSVEGNMKIGNFSIDFIDMDIPMPGFPLTAGRTYDSRNRSIDGDFGYGWNLSINNIKLSESGHPAYDWIQEATEFTGGGWIPRYTWEEEKLHIVSIDWGNGKTEKFAMTLTPVNQAAEPMQDVSVSYTAMGNTTSKLEALGQTSGLYYQITDTVTAEVMVGVDIVVVYFGHLLTDIIGDPWRPAAYRLTAEDGTVYIISAANGVESITDLNGNVITINKNGIHHSDGKSIVFERDVKGRISEIIGPTGKSVSYNYDVNGNLASVTDVSGETTRFEYNTGHFMTDIYDPRGVCVSRNEYDDDGRLIAVISPDGSRLEFNHDVEGRTSVTRDRLGNPTVYVYDERGNVLSTTNARGHTTYMTYDANGNLESRTDALGNITHFAYTPDGKLLSMTDAENRTQARTYDTNGRITTMTNMGDLILTIGYDGSGNMTGLTGAMGETTSLAYDSDGRLTGVADQIGEYQQVAYDASGNVKTITNGAGVVTTYNYDEDGNVISQSSGGYTNNYSYDAAGRVTGAIRSDGVTFTMSYNSLGKLASATDANGSVTRYEYDMFGNLEKITYPDGTTEIFSYDAEGRNTGITDRLGRRYDMVYDALGNLTRKSYPNGGEASYIYDAVGNVTSKTGLGGGITRYEYDGIGRNTAVIDALGNRTEYGYNSLNLMESMKDPLGNVTRYEYDDSGNQTKVIYPDGTFVSTAYDPRGRAVSVTDQNGYMTGYAYDGADRLISVTDANGGVWNYGYDDRGCMTSVSDPKGNTTHYEYDSQSRRVKTIDALGHEALSRYDGATGLLAEYTDFNGVTTYYGYDSYGNMTSIRAGAETVTYAYDAIGRLSSVTDSGGITEYVYDNMNSLSEIRLPGGAAISYTYDRAGNRTGLLTPYGNVYYEYDVLNRITAVTDAFGTTGYAYDANGNVERVTYPNGNRTEYSYNSMNRLTQEVIYNQSNAVVESYIYTRGSAGECLKIEETNRTVVYAYDNLYRLTFETVGASVTGYGYDAASNRISKTENGAVTTYTYNALNQLTGETGAGGVFVYEYDLNGNQTAKKSATLNVTRTYDTHNRLMSVTTNGNGATSVETYKYDYAGNRIETTEDGVTTKYFVDTNGSLAQVVAEIRPGGTVFYTRGLELISMTGGDGTRFYLTDGHGDVRMLTDANGNITDTYTFDAWGNLTARTGNTDNPYLYCGERFDESTGLYYLRARYMDPSAGTFISMDAYAGNTREPLSLHKYLYANANPVTYRDPTGMFGLVDMNISMSISATLCSSAVSNMMKTVGKAAEYSLKYVVGNPATSADALSGVISDMGKDLGKWLSGMLADSLVDFQGNPSHFWQVGQFANFLNQWILGDPMNMDGIDLISQTIAALDTLDKVFGNFMSSFIEKLTGVSGVFGTVGNIIGLYKDIDSSMLKLKALATIYNSGSAGQLYLAKFNAMTSGGDAERAEFMMYAQMGMFDGIQGHTKDLIAAYLLATGLK